MDATTDVEDASDELVRAIERLTAALDAVADDRVACQRVPYQLPMELERLALRVGSGQGLRTYD